MKLELVEAWTRYEVAPDEAFQDSAAGMATPVAALAGALSVGAAGGGGGATVAVVKLQVADQALVPPVFVALARQ